MTLLEPRQPEGGFDTHADPWAKAFIDLPDLNRAVTDAIQKSVLDLRAAARRRELALRTSSLLVLGPAGAGKTHLFRRLRRSLGPKAVFVYLRPLVGTEMTPRYVLSQVMTALTYESAENGRTGLTQLEALVGSSLAHLAGESPDLPRVFLEEMASLDEAERAEKLDAAAETLLERHSTADETYLHRLLKAPFMKSAQKRAARAWLAGDDLEEPQLQRLGVTASLAEERIIGALQTLGLFAAPGAPIVLVFDQLENLIDAEGSGARIRAYGNLVAELFDTMRGYVLVQMALDSEWQNGIFPQLSEAQKTRLAASSQLIGLPSPPQRRELVRLWAEQLPEHPEPFPWPFGEGRVTMWCEAAAMTPRMLVLECKKAWELGPDVMTPEHQTAPLTTRDPGPGPLGDPDDNAEHAGLLAAWDKHLQLARLALDEAARERRGAEPARLLGGLASALRPLQGMRSMRVDARQHVQVRVHIGDVEHAIVLLHQPHPRSVLAALERAGEAAETSRVTLLRERSLEFPPTWKKVESARAALLRTPSVSSSTLEREDAARFLALESFVAAARSGDIEDGVGHIVPHERALDWVADHAHIATWPVVRAITGTGGGATDEDAQALEPEPAPGLHAPIPSPSPAGGELNVAIRTCLAQLRVASVERLVREVVRVDASATRTNVLSALEATPETVRWFGRSIVAAAAEGAR